MVDFHKATAALLVAALAGCTPEVSPPARSPELTLAPPSGRSSFEPVSSPSQSPATAECGGVINTTEPARTSEESLAAVSSQAGLSTYEVATDEVALRDPNNSPFGLVPRFRTPTQVTVVRQRESAAEGLLWGQDSLHEFDTERGESKEILRLPNHVLGHDWSPDGTRLAFLLRKDAGPEDLLVQLCVFDSRNASASLVQLLEPPIGTATGQREETMVTWSPDGARILVVDTAEEPSLVIIEADGFEKLDARSGTFGRWLSNDEIFYQEDPHTDLVSTWTLLSLATGRRTRFELPARSYRPALSPDGRWIAFDDGDRAKPAIFLFDVHLGTKRRLIRGYVAPVWLDPDVVAASGAGTCQGGTCPIPWATTGETVGIYVSTGAQSQLNLPTTLQEDPRNGVIDVWLDQGRAS
jgi:dipeptidyl aminopeptidase/acylaminoacyl peptidase